MYMCMLGEGGGGGGIYVGFLLKYCLYVCQFGNSKQKKKTKNCLCL